MPKLIINIDVPDLPTAERFYTAAFGLRVGRRFSENAVELLGADAPIALLAAPAGTLPFKGAATTRSYARHWSPVHLDFFVRDIEAALKSAVDAGALLEVPIEPYDFGRMAVLSDPFGHGICLIQFEGRGYDEIATG